MSKEIFKNSPPGKELNIMERPKPIIHILSAVDGKITGPFMGMPSVWEANEEYGRIRSAFQADAWLYGTTTTKEFTGFRRPKLDNSIISFSSDDFIAENDAGFYYISVDALGEIRWESATFQKPGRPGAHIIEVLTEQAPAAYRAFLQELGISYILAGKDSLDCKIACEKLYKLFGIRTMLICGGGVINWTFIQQGMADEVSLLITPAADGTADTAAVFQESSFLPESVPVEFRLKSVERAGKDSVHLLYSVNSRR